MTDLELGCETIQEFITTNPGMTLYQIEYETQILPPLLTDALRKLEGDELITPRYLGGVDSPIWKTWFPLEVA